MKPGACLLIFVTAFFFSACTFFAKRAPVMPVDPESRELIIRLENLNGEIKTFKGIGKIKLWADGKVQFNERVAWAGSDPASFRVEVLFSGQSVIKIASDGKWLYYRNIRSEHHPYKKFRLNKSNLNKILSIPVAPDDFMKLLAGRIPVYAHDFASLTKNPAGGFILNLNDKWGEIIEKIYLDERKQVVQQIEIYGSSGSMKYRAVFEKMRKVDNYTIPFRLVISNPEGNRFRLDIHKYVAGVSVPASMFILAPPDK